MDRLYEVAKKIDIELSDHQLEQFQKYYELLVEWNKVMNLTAIHNNQYEYITREFSSKQEAMDDEDITCIRCYKCNKKIIRGLNGFQTVRLLTSVQGNAGTMVISVER